MSCLVEDYKGCQSKTVLMYSVEGKAVLAREELR